MTVDAWEYAARTFEPARRKWPTPGAMAQDLDPHTRQTPALQIVDRELVAAADGHTPRLAIYFSPQEGKSQRVSRRFPAWLLSTDPTLRIGVVSYEYRKAERWGKAVRTDVLTHPQLGITLRADSRAAGEWATTQGGGIVCAGIGSALAGEPLDLLVIDDPVKGRAEAESIVYRDNAWDWWENVGERRLSARMHPDGVVVLMTTRWHTDDLAGRLERRQGHMWRVVNIPAIAESPDDPLGRAPGEEMPSAVGRARDHFHRLQARLSGYVFRALYQQSPTAAEGNLFKRGDWRFWRYGDRPGRVNLDGANYDLGDCRRFATVDLAASAKTSADYTVMAVWAVTLGGDLVLLDRVRARVEEGSHFDLLTPLRQRWLRPHDVTFVESRMFGTTMVYAAGRAGLPLQELKADVDKLTRAIPAADLVRQHVVWLPAGAPWLDEWLDEHAEFPSGAHDDQVDVMAYAALQITRGVRGSAQLVNAAPSVAVVGGEPLTETDWADAEF